MQLSCCWGKQLTNCEEFLERQHWEWAELPEIYGKHHQSWRDHKYCCSVLCAAHTSLEQSIGAFLNSARHNAWQCMTSSPWNTLACTTTGTILTQTTHTHTLIISDHNTKDWVIAAGLGLEKGWLQTFSRWWSMALRCQGQRKME